MNKCPKCGNKAMNLSEKLALRPNKTTQCSSCNCDLTVPKWSLTLQSLIVASILLLYGIESLQVLLFASIGIICLSLFAKFMVVPLTIKNVE